MMAQPTEWMQGYLASENDDNDRISVKKMYIDVNEGNLFDGILFSQIMYWHGKNRETGKPRLTIQRENNLWLAKGYDDWFAECRIVGSTARKCIKRIAARGLIIVKLFMFDGHPMVHIRVNWDILESRIKSIRPVVSNGNDTRGQMEMTPEVKSITDTTAKTTAENKNKSPKPPKGAKKQSESPEITTAVDSIISAYLEATQTIDPHALKNKSKRSDALFMHQQGVKPTLIQEWGRFVRAQEFWKTRAISWRKFAAEILPFQANYTPRVMIVPISPLAPASERAKPDEVISEAQREELRQMFEALVNSKDANNGKYS